jgi:hypothetical protein
MIKLNKNIAEIKENKAIAHDCNYLKLLIRYFYVWGPALTQRMQWAFGQEQ